MTEAHPPYQAPRPDGGPYPPPGSGATTWNGGAPQYYQQPVPGGAPYQPVPGQAQYYQQPVPGAAPAQLPRRRRTGLVVLVVALVVVLVAGGGTAAWWFVLRNRGTTFEPRMAVPDEGWADGATQTGSSTIKTGATISVSPDGSFLAALTPKSPSDTSSGEATLTGYTLADGRASESWNATAKINSIKNVYLEFWGNDTIVLNDTLYDVATGDHHNAPWRSGAALIVNDLALGCADGSCTAWKKDGSRAWSVEAGRKAQVAEGSYVRGGKHYVVAGATIINIDDADSLILDVPETEYTHGQATENGWAVQTYDDLQNGHLYTFTADGRRIGDTAIKESLDNRRFFLSAWGGPQLSAEELTAWLSGESDEIPKNKRMGEFTEDNDGCVSHVTIDNGPSFDAPEIHLYEDGKTNRICSFLQPGTTPKGGIVLFIGTGFPSPTTEVHAMVNAKTGDRIDTPGLDPAEGDFLVFANPRTAVGYSPKDGALTTYRPAG